MPAPKPKQGESQSDFMGRCVPFFIDEGSDQDQAVAACLNIFRESKKELSPGSIVRAYARIDAKALDDDKMIIVGMATTPSTDRLGDIVEPLGVEFKNPMPLLWQHRHDQPVGMAKFKKPSKDGIEFEARLADVQEPGRLKERIDEAWQSVKHGLVRGVSIGFRPIEFAFKDDGGIRFEKTEVIELSLVTIPANTEATITQIKSADMQARSNALHERTMKIVAALGQPKDKLPALRGTRAKEKTVPKTIAEQISAFDTERAAKSARMATIMESTGDELVTLDETQSEEYDTLKADVQKIDAHLVRLRELESINRAAMKPVETPPSNIILPMPAHIGRVQVKQQTCPKGHGFVRLAMAMMSGKGDVTRMLRNARLHYPDMPELAQIIEADPASMVYDDLRIRAAVGAGTTTDTTWAAPLVVFNNLASEFIELLRPATIIGRITNLRRVPFNIQMPATSSGTSMNWVGENAPKPVTKMDFTTVTLRWSKAAGIVVMTEELVRFSNPAAESVVRDDMIKAMTQFLDRQFVDPAVAEITNVSPASITNGVTPITASGVNETAFRADVKLLLSGFLANNLSTTGGVWIMTQQQALALSLMINALGQPSFPTITGEGGTLMGYPVVASENLPATGGSPADGYPIIFALAPEIMLADDGQTVIDASNQASVQMDSTPTSPPDAAGIMVSLWQMNMVGLRAERWINWKKRRATAVSFIQNAKYA